MAITTSGAPAIVEIYNDADNAAHAGAPGTHTDAEISALVAATFTDLLSTPKNYNAGLTIQLGKAPGSAFTSLTITKDIITMAAGKQFTGLIAAGPNTWLNVGTKIGAGNIASGKRGPHIRGGSAINLPCNIQAYGAVFESETGGISLGGAAGLTKVEIQNCLVTAATIIQLGFSDPSPVVVYNADFQSDTTVASVFTNLFTKRMERGTVSALNPVAFLLWNQNVTPSMRDFSFFGTPSVADVRITSNPILPLKVVQHVWSGGPRFHNTAVWVCASPDLGNAAWEYGVIRPTVQQAGTGIRLAGIEIQILDSLGLEVLPWTATDADGLVEWGDDANTNYGNAARVLDYYRNAAISFGYSWRDRGPFTFNARDPNHLYLPATKTLGYPQRSSTYGPVLRGEFTPVIEMVRSVASGSEEFRSAA